MIRKGFFFFFCRITYFLYWIQTLKNIFTQLENTADKWHNFRDSFSYFKQPTRMPSLALAQVCGSFAALGSLAHV